MRIEVERPNGKYGRDDEDDAYLTLRVPSRARLVVDTVSAEIGVTGARGEQSLESVSGEVRTQAFDAPVRGNLSVGRRHRDGQRRQGGRDDRERERHDPP